jgi:hypothetical protein
MKPIDRFGIDLARVRFLPVDRGEEVDHLRGVRVVRWELPGETG